MALEQLRGVTATNKHVLVITDDRAPEHGVDELVAEMARAGITVSAVATGSALEPITDLGDGETHDAAGPDAVRKAVLDDVRDARLAY
jgi:hypothetical protein